MEKLAWQLMLQTCVSLVVDDPSQQPMAVSADDRLDFAAGRARRQGPPAPLGRGGRTSVADRPATRPPHGSERPNLTDDTRIATRSGTLGRFRVP